MLNKEIEKINIERLIVEKFPNKKFPRIVTSIIKKIIHQDDINNLFANAPGMKNLDFIDSCMEQLKFTCNVIGEEYLPSDGRNLIFASNHPQGGSEAICIAHVLGHKYAGKIKFYANQFLTILAPLNEMFLPIYKHQQQNREAINIIKEFYKTDNHLIVFPAGVTSHKSKGKVVDHDWHKSFIKASVRYQRDVVPLYFDAKNSEIFYCIENFRKKIHSKINFEVLLFANEFFKQKGKTFTLHIGKPIPWKTFNQRKAHDEWANWVKDLVFDLPNQK